MNHAVKYRGKHGNNEEEAGWFLARKSGNGRAWICGFDIREHAL
jgi:hypothetical protein